MLVVGSKALEVQCRARGDELNRTPCDIDVMGTYDECMAFVRSLPGKLDRCYPAHKGKKIVAFKGGKIIEAEIAWEGSTAEEFIRLESESGQVIVQNNLLYASLNGLYALKTSHKFLRNSPAFLKTMRDIQYMESLGSYIPEEYTEWLRQREKETYWYDHPNLKQSKKDFFTDSVPYIYDHDSLHLAVKHLEHPAYTYYMKDGEEVQTSKEKFYSVSDQIRLLGVLEESYVLALERSQIPHGDKITPRKSFEIALMKVCTSITSGWFREYAWNNYDNVVAMYSDSYKHRFLNALDAGIVIPYTG